MTARAEGDDSRPRPSALADVFLTQALRRRPDLEVREADLREGLALLLPELVAAAGAAWPGVALSPEDFVAHLGGLIPAGADPEGWLAAMYVEDLYLACACLHGVKRALVAFEERFLAQLPAYLPSVAVDRVDEIKQVLRSRYFVAAPGSAPKIAGYAGRGPLAGWVRQSAQRAAADLRGRSDAVPLDEGDQDRALQTQALAEDPELDYLKGTYRRDFKLAFQAAVAALSEEDQALLRLYSVAGLTTTQIGVMMGLHHTNVSRRLKAVREALFEGTRRELTARLRLSPSELESVIRLARSQLDVSLARVLGGDRQVG